MSETRKLNQTANKVLKVPCIKCGHETNHKVMLSYDVSGEQEDVQYGWHDQVLLCQGCDTTTFRTVSWNSEDYELDEDGFVPSERVQLYPSRIAGRVAIEHHYYLPARVRPVYEETIAALNNDQPILAGIGLRALVETVCKDKNAAGRDLHDRINDLVQKGVLTANGATILHKVRTLGNKAAHEVEPHTSEQLRVAMDVCEHLLADVYIIQHLAKKL